MKRKIIFIFVFFIILSVATAIYASTDNITLTASETTLQKGDTFTVSITGNAENNIIGLKGTLEFDEGLQLVKKEGKNNFTEASKNDTEVAFACGSTGDKNVEIGVYTFKVLETADIGTTTISIKDITLATDVNESVEDVEITLLIKDEEKDTINNTTNNTVNNTTNTISNSNTSNSDTTTKQTAKIAQTGSTGFVIIGIIAVLGVISFVSYKKYKNI